MSEQYDAIIIGAGIGGLTAGNILAKNGMKVLILEKNPVAGGAVTTFYREGYPIDISHSLCALNDGSFIKRIIEYLGISDKLSFVQLDKSFIYFLEGRAKPLYAYANFDKYSSELAKFFPAQNKNIDEMLLEIKKTWENDILNSYYAPSFFCKLAYPFIFPRVFRYRNLTFYEFLDCYKISAPLKEVVSLCWPYLGVEGSSLSALYMFCLMGAYHVDGTYFLKGGCGALSNVLAHSFENSGGKIIYNTEVTQILLNKNNEACGVIRNNVTDRTYGKTIISNIDSKKTFFELFKDFSLEGKSTNKLKMLNMSSSAIQVHIVAEAEIDSSFLSSGSIIIPQNKEGAEKLKNLSPLVLSINKLSEFNLSASNNEFVFNCVWLTNEYSRWFSIQKTKREEYESLKKIVFEQAISMISRIAQIRKVNFYNVLTPASFKNWLNSENGCIYDAAVTPNQALQNRFTQKTFVRNLYLVGSKTFPGPGIAGAISSAVPLADIILKRRLSNGKFILPS